MEQVIQVTGLCVVGALLALVVKRGSPETALLLTVAAAVVVLLALAGAVEELLAFLAELAEGSGVPPALFGPLYKTIGIALVVQVGGSLCRDAGESAMPPRLTAAPAKSIPKKRVRSTLIPVPISAAPFSSAARSRSPKPVRFSR